MTRMLPTSIDVTPEAAAFIREKGGSVVLRSTVKLGCCGGRAERGLIDALGKPIRIGLDQMFRMRTLYVENIPSQ